jgi:hypothetical protein
LPLLHALQQRGLGLRRGPVDLVADHQVGEHGPGPELEVVRLLVVDADAGHVRRQQVGGELDPADRAVHRARQRLGQLGLADSGNVLDEQVTLGEQDHDRQPDGLRLAVDDPLDVRRDPATGLADHVHPDRSRAARRVLHRHACLLAGPPHTGHPKRGQPQSTCPYLRTSLSKCSQPGTDVPRSARNAPHDLLVSMADS